MTNDKKREAVRRLLHLRREFNARKMPDGTPDAIKEMQDRAREKVREVTAELYFEHFSEAQLKALLDFYGSELGQSIVDTQSLIREQLKERMKDISVGLNAESKESSSVSGVRSGFVRSSTKPKPPRG